MNDDAERCVLRIIDRATAEGWYNPDDSACLDRIFDEIKREALTLPAMKHALVVAVTMTLDRAVLDGRLDVVYLDDRGAFSYHSPAS